MIVHDKIIGAALSSSVGGWVVSVLQLALAAGVVLVGLAARRWEKAQSVERA